MVRRTAGVEHRAPTGTRGKWCRSWRALLFVLAAELLSGCVATRQIRVQADEHYRLAQSYLGHASYRLAEQEIRKALELLPREARYFELLALIYQAQGRLHLAAAAYRMALQQAHVPPSVLVNYSTVMLLQERPDAAIALAQRALRDPGYSKPALAHTNIGLAYLQKGALYQAVEHLRTALEYQPDLPEAHHNLGLVYKRLGQYGKAIRAFRQAIRLRPAYIEAYASLGEVLLENGQREEARHAFERVIALAPESEIATSVRKQLRSLTP